MKINQPNKIKLLFLTSEIAPFCSTYSLSKFSRIFSMILNDNPSIEIRMSQPKYGYISERKYILREVIRLKEVPINFNSKERMMSIKSAFIPNTKVQVYFLLDNGCFGKTTPLIYKAKNGKPLKNNLENFTIFSLSLLESFKKLFWYPDVIICNDWQTALIPYFFKHRYQNDENYKNIKSINLIHSINNYRKVNDNIFEKFDLDIKHKKNLDILSDSMSYFDFNILIDNEEKELFEKIKKNKGLHSCYKKSKSSSIILRDDADIDEWTEMVDYVISKIKTL